MELARGLQKITEGWLGRPLEKLPDCHRRLFETLSGGKAQSRIVATEWLVRLKPPGAADAICAALEVEKTTTVKAALASALQSLEGTPASSPESDTSARDTLRAEAAKGLKAGHSRQVFVVPIRSAARSPVGKDRTPVEGEVLRWLVVSAWKTKSAEPTVLLCDQVKLIRDDDVRRLGKFVLETWLAEDLRPPTGRKW